MKISGILCLFFASTEGLRLENTRAEHKPSSKFSVERFATNPLIGGLHPDSEKKIGLTEKGHGYNANGPHVIKVPDWIENKKGKYYMYFAHHRGTHIRMAYADALEGPWTIYNPGKGVLHIDDMDGCKGHIASPDIHVDEANKRLYMYFHTMAGSDRGQYTPRPLTSNDGLKFGGANPECKGDLGDFYFRRFQHNGINYAVSKKHSDSNMGGQLYMSKNADGTKWKRTNAILGKMRHGHVWANAFGSNESYIVYTNIGDIPESVLIGKMKPDDDGEFKVGTSELLVRPTEKYEGGDIPSRPGDAATGPVKHPEKGLRDPFIYVEGDNAYVFYTLAGEYGIGGARITKIG